VRAILVATLLTSLTTAMSLIALPAANTAAAAPCSTAGAWRQDELNIYWVDVEQGDAQLLVGPTGKTLLIDLGENAYNPKWTNTNATDVAAQIRNICGTGTTLVALDSAMASPPPRPNRVCREPRRHHPDLRQRHLPAPAARIAARARLHSRTSPRPCRRHLD
jgi:hypothetical protein